MFTPAVIAARRLMLVVIPAASVTPYATASVTARHNWFAGVDQPGAARRLPPPRLMFSYGEEQYHVVN